MLVGRGMRVPGSRSAVGIDYVQRYYCYYDIILYALTWRRPGACMPVIFLSIPVSGHLMRRH